MMSNATVLTFISLGNHLPSQQLASVLREVVTANKGAGLTVEVLDVDADAARARELGIISYPAVVLHTGGHERGRLVGPQSKRAVLQLLLPDLYDDDEALRQLRRQLHSPGENFPRRVLKRRERVTKAARMAMLGGVPLFDGLTRRQLEAVAAVADEVVVDAGAPVTEEGTDGDQFFVVVSGTLEVRRRGRKVATCGAGDCVGEMSLLDGGPRSATVTATERCVLLTLDRSTFQSLLHDAPELSIALLEVLSKRLRGA